MFFMALSMLYFVICFFLFVCFCNRLILHGCWIPFLPSTKTKKSKVIDKILIKVNFVFYSVETS